MEDQNIENNSNNVWQDPSIKTKVPRWSLFFSALILLSLLFLFFKFTEIKTVINLLYQIKPVWFFLAVLAQAATYFFTALIYRDILAIYDRKDFSLKELYKLSVVGLFITQVIPTAGVSGNSYIATYLNRRKVPPAKSVLAVALEMLTFYSAHLLILIAAFAYLFFYRLKSLSVLIILVTILGALIYILLIGLALFLGSRRVLDLLSGQKEKKRWMSKLFEHLKVFNPQDGAVSENVWAAFFNNFRRLLPALLWQIAIILADAAAVYFIFLGFNFRASLIGVLFGLILTKIVAMVSFTPGSLVFFEGAMILFYSAFGIPLQLSVMATIIFRALSFWLPMPFGLIFYRHLRDNYKNNSADPV